MSRRPSFFAPLSLPVERLLPRSAALAIVLIVALSWAACVGGAWVIAGAVRLVARWLT